MPRPPTIRRVDGELLGRDAEVAVLRRWLGEALAGRGRVVLVAGEAGVGKSALVAHLVEQARAEHTRVLVGRTTEADGAPPNWPWLQVLDQLGGRAILDGPAGSDPDSEQFARHEAVRGRLLDEPGLVVIEDAHRADPASLRLLTHVAEAVAGAPVLLVVTHRSEHVDRTDGFDVALEVLGRSAGAGRLELTGVDRASVARLLPDGLAASAVEEVWAVSDGNPLLVGELARHLAGGATLATVPRSMRDGVALRLSRRTAACADAVRFAAVAGRSFRAGLLATVTGHAALHVLAALDEATAAALVEPTERPGEFRFVHALVRDAVLATMGSAELARRHRELALAVEAYDPDGDARALELARLWDAAAVLGEASTAADRCTRAGAAAQRQLAWEDAGRWYERALELGGTTMTPVEEHERAVGAARALVHSGELPDAIARCVQAAGAARRAGRAELAAEAALVPEGRGGPDPDLESATRTALDELPPDAHALRARLHAQLTNLAFYTDPDPSSMDSSMEAHCARAEGHAASAGDPEAEMAALRARHMRSYGPEHAELRLALAGRLARAASAARKPSVGVWAPLWRIDALVELGRVPEAIATLPELQRATLAAAAPIAQWHRHRIEAALAAATGRFEDADAEARVARDLFARLESPYGADAMYLGFRIAVELHTGFTPELTEAWTALDLQRSPSFIGELPLVGSAIVALAAGDIDRARHWYRQLPDVAGWTTSPALRLHLHALRAHAAVALGETAELPDLYGALAPHRHLHVGSGGGTVTYVGPVELWLGVVAAGLGRADTAVGHLTTAAGAAHAAGTPGFAVQAEVELADTLLGRGGPGDAEAARDLLVGTRPVAARLAMAPFGARIDRLLTRCGPPAARHPLSARELEVVALVAAGRTNREIAAELFISERTAQNHVQHILTKLGLDNRTQIATWHLGTTPAR